MAIDPYRVLGLAAGASAAEVKRAYRRLAKANHPDSAGEAALPRFLEIQRAYETLTAGTWRPGTRRPSTSGSSSGEPWRADFARARSTAGAQPPPGGPAGGRTGGARPGATDAASGRPGSARGPAGSRSRSGPGPRANDPSSARAGAGSAGAGTGATGRRRASRKATFGSTTYDEAREGADTSWSGASWYGQSSGEYWRVNPREYADPRKHGPEYLARAAARAAAAAERRARQGAGDAPGDADADAEPGAERDPGATAAGAATDSGAHRERPAAPPPPRPTWAGHAREAAADIGGQPGDGAPPGPWPRFALSPSPGLRRLLRAVIAWPPLGIAAAAVIGETTGCAAFEATCTPPADLYPWLAQAAILLALLGLPAIARILAGGTVAVVLLAFPVAAALSASGATYDRTYGPAALIAVLAIVWAVGVGAVVLRRAVTRGLP